MTFYDDHMWCIPLCIPQITRPPPQSGPWIDQPIDEITLQNLVENTSVKYTYISNYVPINHQMETKFRNNTILLYYRINLSFKILHIKIEKKDDQLYIKHILKNFMKTIIKSLDLTESKIPSTS